MNSTVKLKIKNESTYFLLNLSANCTIKELIDEILKVTNNGNDDITLLTGFPPKPINIDLELTLSEAKIISGDCIILKINPSSQIKRPKLAFETERKIDKKPSVQHLASENNSDSNLTMKDLLIPPRQNHNASILIKKTIPADNSCLFASVYYCLNNASLSGFDSDNERQLVCAMLLSQPNKFDKAFLEDKTPEVYCEWIMNKDRWGGSIELHILSNLNMVEIDVVNINTDRIDRFGEDCNYSHKILILYDGIHYDSLALEDTMTGKLTAKYPVTDNEVIEKAKQLAKELKSLKQFTDVNRFRIKCYDCNVVMIGQSEVVKHANTTGHSNFGEIESS